ncbi:MFS general substrate transporter [Cristinia sonorae]|uniref:MFS general substrate transporter n=1 Tax=Cristinia sonorae TaxID=1940300 RepID=A0A8K0UNH8_9AGAR|nr:MFS general substrate transporter [Cristinia sonorae]
MSTVENVELSTLTPIHVESQHESRNIAESLVEDTAPSNRSNTAGTTTTFDEQLGSGGEFGANVQVLEPVDRGRKAWTFCFCAFVLETIVWGFGFSYGIFQTYYTSHPPFNTASPVAIAAVGTTALALQYGEGLILSLFFGRYPDKLKQVMWAGLVVSTLSLFLSSFVSTVWALILLQGVGFGIGGGMLYMPIIGLLSEWFVERRGLAGGIIFAGSGVGGFVFPLMVNALLDRLGFRWTLRIWAIGTAVISALSLLGINHRLPVPKFHRGQRRPRLIPPQMHFLKRAVFWSFTATTVLQALSFFPVSLYIAMFTTSISSPLSATITLSLFNSSGVVGQILVGFLTDKFPYHWIMFVSALGSAISAFLLWGFADTLARVFAFAIIFGGLGGGFSSVWPAAALDSAGRNPEHSTITFTCFALTKGIAAVIGPILSGVLLEFGKNHKFATSDSYGKFGFGSVEVFVGSCALATSLGSLVVAAVRTRAR